MTNSNIEILNNILIGIKNIPYENITKIFRLELPPNIRPRNEALLLKEYNESYRGGTCFSLSNTILQILRDNNISANFAMGKMERETFPHFFVIFDFKNEKYFIDSGFMIYNPIKLTLDKRNEFSTSITDYLLEYDKENEYKLYSLDNNKKKFRYSFSPTPINDEKFNDYWIKSFDYINSITASKIVDNKHIFISGDFVQIKQKNTIEKYKGKNIAYKYLIKYFNFTEKEILKSENFLKLYNNIETEPKRKGV